LVNDVTHCYLQDGYKLVVKKLEPVDNTGKLKLTNLKIELLEDCHLLLKGTVELTTGFSTCKVCLYMRYAHCATQCYLSEQIIPFTQSLRTVLSVSRCAH
jgi:hypothetical protein